MILVSREGSCAHKHVRQSMIHHKSLADIKRLCNMPSTNNMVSELLSTGLLPAGLYNIIGKTVNAIGFGREFAASADTMS